jgi:hypothetical protein
VAEISEKHMASKTLIAFDHMRIPLSYLEWGYKINSLYKELLNDDETQNSSSEEEEVKKEQKPAKQQKQK